MTRVTIRADCIEIEGHAPLPVVCHGISSVSQMTANYLEKINHAQVERSNGYIRIYDIVTNNHLDHLLNAFIDALKDIDTEYPGNIEFNYE